MRWKSDKIFQPEPLPGASPAGEFALRNQVEEIAMDHLRIMAAAWAMRSFTLSARTSDKALT